ncbi:DUF4198 domain-containing protein [Rhodobacteraceae bacterium N5(2021)]|uniref:DUF4198 domain-containing protein n=1 Tax=Gymnodinialimonas phycosphaerae TaxID=2841589 RepID=A0A975TTB3_9RHOB|nr:DUF4198 domain-containing protein [Gymnodinialimonas phycosphaerae]MBY4894196.1 DUF4198 domain-containing protein [Gymnodinialimonas phycosphaerae]
MKSVYLALVIAALAVTDKATAHEFWIDPQDFTVEVGDALLADLRVGQEFSGAAMSYLPRNFDTFTVINGGAVIAVEGRFGDIPALNMGGLNDGLAVIVHQTTANQLTWSEWERFLNFAIHKDLGDVTAMHEARNLSQEDVTEDYIRYAKSLVAVGDGAGDDVRVGLRAELVALSNPYTDVTEGGIPMQLWYDNALQPDYQVELFAEDAEGEVTITYHRTDSEGVVLLPVVPGMTYMADAVFLEAVEPASEGDAIWVTHWANMTFSTAE